MYRKNGIWLLPKLYCNTTIALQAAGQAGAHRRGRWALGAHGAGQAGAGRWGVSRAGALQADGRAGRAAGRAAGARGRGARQGRAAGARGRGARQGRGAGARGKGARQGRAARARDMSGRRAGALAATQPRGCCDTAPVRAAMHGLGVAWCAGWASWGLMQPVWFLTWVFDSGVFLSHRMDSVHEHCS